MKPQRWIYVVLVVGLLVVCTPFVWMVTSSFKPEGEMYRTPPTLLPDNATLDNYLELFDKLDLARLTFNSVLVAVVTTVGTLALSSMLGYALAKLDFPGKRLLFGVVMAKLMIPTMVLMVPTFVVVAKLGLVDTYAGIILPGLAGSMGVFLMRQYMLGLPDDLAEAARIDGASEYRIFLQIFLPLCKPALATLGILTFLGSWNNFLWPLIVAQTGDMYTLPVGVALFALENQTTDYGLLLAGATSLVLPVLVVFVFFQRHFVQGIATTGLK